MENERVGGGEGGKSKRGEGEVKDKMMRRRRREKGSKGSRGEGREGTVEVPKAGVEGRRKKGVERDGIAG